MEILNLIILHCVHWMILQYSYTYKCVIIIRNYGTFNKDKAISEISDDPRLSCLQILVSFHTLFCISLMGDLQQS